MFFCHKCKKELNIRGTIGRGMVCPYCQSFIHCCKNCGSYRIGTRNECSEPNAESIADKGGANLCDYFTLKGHTSPPVDHEEEVRKAREKLEALFKKSS